jgi:hypothetical protein
MAHWAAASPVNMSKHKPITIAKPANLINLDDINFCRPFTSDLSFLSPAEAGSQINYL